MKRALIIANSSGLITLFLKNDIELLIEQGYAIDCACNTNFPDLNTDNFFKKFNIKVTHVDFPIRNLDIKMIASAYRKLHEIMKMDQYRVVHCHSTIAAALARQCAKKYRKNGTKVFYTSHGFPFYEGADGKKEKLYRVIENYYSRHTDAIITICGEDFQNAKQMHCKNVYKINGVGVNLDRFKLSDFDRNAYREKLGFRSGDKVILSVGELNTNKNHQIIIKAISLLNDKDIVYAICGREVTEVGKKQELEDLANQLGVTIKFLGFRSDIPEVCYSVDIGAIPSFKEGLGLSGVEMLAVGIPVVGSKRQGIKDYIHDGKTGYLCNPEDPKSFAEGVKRTLAVCTDEKIRFNCRDEAEKFSVANARKIMDSIYTEILNS